LKKKIFQKIKLSYVGHTQEDVEALFSIISRFFKRQLKCIPSISAFVEGLSCSLKVPPKGVEQIKYCYDYSDGIGGLLQQDIGLI